MGELNDLNNPKYEEEKENYYEMIDKLKRLGKLRDILHNHDLVMQIVAYNGDRHLFAAFIDLINEALEKHEIFEDDLEIFTSGEVADAIVNIKETVRRYGNRYPYPSEVWDKLNYLALIKSGKAYAASFTHPKILDALAGHGSMELTEWATTPHEPPIDGFAVVVSALIEKGYIEAAGKYLETNGYYSLKCTSEQKENGFSIGEGVSRPLTNGSRDPNGNRGASGESYEELIKRIKSLGTIKEILKNPSLIKQIIAYNGDRHFFAVFIEMVNDALEKHEIWDDDLEVFTSGEVADAIVNIRETAMRYGNRSPYPSEVWDKLNYLSLIKDDKAYAASFTHPKILDALAGHGSMELTQWTQTSHEPPIGGFAAIIYRMMERGNVKEAKEFLDRVGYYAKKYSQANRMGEPELTGEGTGIRR